MIDSGYKLVNEIEGKYEVDTISYKNVPIWLLLRNNIYFYLTQGALVKLKLTFKNKLTAFLSSFRGCFNFFRKTDAWFFGISSSRVKIDNTFFDRFIDYPASRFKRSLIIEIPFYKHFSKKESYSKRIASKGFLIILEKLYVVFFLRSKHIKNERLLNYILDTYNIDFDYLSIAQKMVAQYKVMKFILKFNTPKFVFFGTSYTNYGYIKAFRERGVKIFEIQHGVINKEHFGYFINGEFPELFFPDKLLTFGYREFEVFNDENNNGINSKNIIPVGSFYLEHIYKKFSKDYELTSKCSNYKKVISVSLQDCSIGEKLIPILIALSCEHKDVLFLLKRRNKSLEYYLSNYTFNDNIIFIENLNVYQTILHSDLHITAYSSCALEAPALGVKNLLINIENKSKLYYDTILNKKTTLILGTGIDVLSDFLGVFKFESYEAKSIMSFHSDVVIPNFINNFNLFIDENIDEKFTF